MSAPTPIETYKRVLAATTKALSGKRELEVQFGGEVAGLVNSAGTEHLVLPTPPVKMTLEALGKSRGEADALALRLALHDEEIFSKDLPRPGPARAICEALEQARVESLGAKVMDGVSDNLYAAQEARCQRRGFHQEGLTQDDAPLAEAVGVLAREVFSGRPAPEGADGLMGAWRQYIEKSGSDELAKLSELLHDQKKFAKTAKELLQAFDLGDEYAEAEPGDEDEDEESREDEDNNPQNAQDEEDQSDPGSAQVSEADMLEDDSADAQDMVDADDIDGESTEGEEAPDQHNRRPELVNSPAPYSVYTRSHDEVIKAEDLCEVDELVRLRTYLDGHMAGLSAVIARLANRPYIS